MGRWRAWCVGQDGYSKKVSCGLIQEVWMSWQIPGVSVSRNVEMASPESPKQNSCTC